MASIKLSDELNVPMSNSKEFASILSRNAENRKKLNSLLKHQSSTPATLYRGTVASQNILFDGWSSSERALESADVVVTANEVNQRHGTGVLVSKIFKEPHNIFSIRAHNHYDGEHLFGDVSVLISCKGLSRQAIFSSVLDAFGLITPGRVLCIPFDPDETQIAIAIKEIFNVPLATYIMDDNNVCSRGISDQLMQELLEKSSLRLAISPELKQAYEKKYNLRFWLLPPVVSTELILETESAPIQPDEAPVGILVGNIWGQRWLDLLRQTVRGSGITIHWYCNSGKNCKWLNFDQDELASDGIFIRDPLPEPELASLLRQYLFALLPSGTLDSNDDNRAVAQLSLPTRVPFITATSHTPVIVLGSSKTSSGRFVERFQVGMVASYDLSSFQSAVAHVIAPEQQIKMRSNARAIAPTFADQNIGQWIWKALDTGEPDSSRFGAFLSVVSDEAVPYTEPSVPKHIFWGFVPDYQALRRLKDVGFNPDFIIDVGASTGIWSYTINHLFPNARFILIEPLLSMHNSKSRKYFIDRQTNFEVVEAAASNHIGSVDFQVSPDLYGSSLFQPVDRNDYQTISVPVTTLDQLTTEKNVSGRGMLKVDVQCAEHLVLEGANHLLKSVDVVQLELTLPRLDEEAKTFTEMIQYMMDLGFRYYDDAGCWRDTLDGTLLQKDVLFVKKELFN